MSNNYHRLYVENNLRFARTACVKFEDAAWGVNQAIIDDHGQSAVDVEHPQTWKYYQNIAGHYHPLDTKMTIVSLDEENNRIIPFNKTTLVNNPITKRYYQHGTRYYRELVMRYPKQEELILGILYAPDSEDFITTVVGAKDATILYVAPDTIEENEHDLMVDLQAWSYQYFSRWVNKTFSLIDPLYPALYIGQYYLHLLQKLITLRLRACKSPQTHSYHVREYLRSHGMLDRYINMLTLKQALFLYRNILYIEANSGKRAVFAWLIENIMTERNLPMYEYVARHDTSPMIDDLGKTLSLDPAIVFKKKKLNFKTTSMGDEVRTPEQLMAIMNTTPTGNQEEHIYKRQKITDKFLYSPSNVVQTKVVESLAEDVNDASPYALDAVIITHMFSYTSSGNYQSRIEYTFPGTKKSVFLPVKDAVALFTYCWLKYMGQDTLYKKENGTEDFPIPKIELFEVFDTEDLGAAANVAQDQAYIKRMKSVVTPGNFNAEDLQQFIDIKNDAKLEDFREIKLRDSKTFNEQCVKIHRAGIYYNNIIGVAPNFIAMGEVEKLISMLYRRRKVTLVTEKKKDHTEYNYEEWVAQKNYLFVDVSQDQYRQHAMDLLDMITGIVSLANVSVKEVQRAMLGVMRTLSSYSIYFASDVDESEITQVANCAPWAVAVDTVTRELIEIELINSYIIDHTIRSSDSYFIEEYLEPPSTECHNEVELSEIIETDYQMSLVVDLPDDVDHFPMMVELMYADIITATTREL